MVVAAAGAALVLGCGGGTKSVAGDDVPVRETSISVDSELVEIVFLESERGFGRDRLSELALSGPPHVRLRAIRALGRLGDPLSQEVLARLLTDSDAMVQLAAASALAIAGAEGVEGAIADLFRNSTERTAKATFTTALGRVGTAASLPVLISALADSDPTVAEAGAVALGLYGRRKLSLDISARSALITAASSHSEGVRYGVAYALAREHEPGEDRGVVATLTALAQDRGAETRALAVFGLARRAAAASIVPLAIADDDWRVRVQAARSLRAMSLDGDQVAAATVRLAREWAVLSSQAMVGPNIHVISEGLRVLATPALAANPTVLEVVEALYTAAAERLGDDSDTVALAASTVHCLAAAVRVAGGAEVDLLVDCGGSTQRGMPVFARRALIGDAIANGSVADARSRLALLDTLARNEDPRIRASAVDAAAVLAVDEAIRAAAVVVIEAGLADDAIGVAGSAAAAVASLAETAGEVAAQLAGPLVSRASAGSDDLELLSSLIDALRATKAAGGAAICQAARFHSNAAIRGAARVCAEAYTGTDPGYADAESPPDRVDVNPAGLLGKDVIWTVETTKGTIVMELDADVAPWHIAVIISLVDKGFYDDVLFHRVVPDFVVQGGDPTGSGWGGPGFVVPGEPSDAAYSAGAVGIADAGMDTGGSQWFIMHSRASHLEARYTHLGKVTRGQEVVDALVVGDRIVRAKVDVVTRRTVE